MTNPLYKRNNPIHPPTQPRTDAAARKAELDFMENELVEVKAIMRMPHTGRQAWIVSIGDPDDEAVTHRLKWWWEDILVLLKSDKLSRSDINSLIPIRTSIQITPTNDGKRWRPAHVFTNTSGASRRAATYGTSGSTETADDIRARVKRLQGGK